ncbi:similar to Saccharomyces cerevisiae YIL121W QDR2 Multidrug transporter of the major facilitator superfamily, required for resistance to quinidine, barban, cisplatin, and bleomycin [Maudiozyma saulgeensis]|uniref:Similar to Saccharomyces cerevisiae YIL121W QDR2 Multidrug transporter of the major facilitator superfamily, required for resistance to quinidine, barban, cisplatin, and bleomycin n=1 Tax=Maudiozyma saulgeensis TaxID=1789683 RepID=A0A1X7R4F5_9SACH|nr:similar to Saccharomyces cerevisiae YIL121W QDR2 Multidrug transporter of the major facilitator superfamily, required for resistance to quinidine, barban, cisplatin, and bleomycin [Kazachstania saulgeensis]
MSTLNQDIRITTVKSNEKVEPSSSMDLGSGSDIELYDPNCYSGENSSIDQPSDSEFCEIVRTKSVHDDSKTPIEYEVPRSRFDRRAKMILVIQCAFTGFFSSIAGAIYYPVLNVIEGEFHINEEQVNITVVVYFLFQGVAPSIMGGLADSLGRRPVVLTSIILYFCACIGLARSQNYGQIVGLRCLQAAGISPVIAINSGIMGDVTTKPERGGYVGYVSGFQVIGSAFGALIGAALANRWSWRSIFWFLVIGSGVCLLFSIIILAETKRTIVGNGSIKPKSIFNKAPILMVPYVKKVLHLNNPDIETLEPPMKLDLLAPLDIIKNLKMSILLYVAGMQFAMWSTHQTALSTALSSKYSMSVIDIGLCYLPTGLCTMASVVTSGRWLNWAYTKKFNKYKLWRDSERARLLEENNHNESKVDFIMDNDPNYTFNLFRARLGMAFITLVLSSGGFIAFGWCLEVKAPLAAVLVCSGFASLFSNCILTMSTTVIVDLYPSKTSTATGCLNLYRCLLSALFIGCLSRMITAMGYGGVFTLIGSVNAASSFLILWLVKHGKEIAMNRRHEEDALKKPLINDEEKQMDELDDDLS